jgi:hypothetical protein
MPRPWKKDYRAVVDLSRCISFDSGERKYVIASHGLYPTLCGLQPLHATLILAED